MLVLTVVSLPKWVYQYYLNSGGITVTSDGLKVLRVDESIGALLMLSFWTKYQKTIIAYMQKNIPPEALLTSIDKTVKIVRKNDVDREKLKVGTIDNKGCEFVWIGGEALSFVLHRNYNAEYWCLTPTCNHRKLLVRQLYDHILDCLVRYIDFYDKSILFLSNTRLHIKSYMEVNGIDITSENFNALEKAVYRREKVKVEIPDYFRSSKKFVLHFLESEGLELSDSNIEKYNKRLYRTIKYLRSHATNLFN